MSRKRLLGTTRRPGGTDAKSGLEEREREGGGVTEGKYGGDIGRIVRYV